MDYRGLIRAHVYHTFTCAEEIGGITGYGDIKGLGWRAGLVLFGIQYGKYASVCPGFIELPIQVLLFGVLRV